MHTASIFCSIVFLIGSLGHLVAQEPSPENNAKGTAKLSLAVVESQDLTTFAPLRPYLKKGEDRIAFRKPSNSTIWSDGNSLSLIMPEQRWSSLTVQHSPILPQSSESRGGDEAFLEVIAGLTGDTTKPEKRPCPYRVMGWKGQTFVSRVLRDGQVFTWEISFVDVDVEQQIMVILKTPDAERSIASALARTFLNSWFPLTEKQDATLN